MPFSDKEGWERFLAWSPETPPGVSISGVKSALGIEMTNIPFVYNVTTENEGELAYHLTKWYHENYESYKALTPTTPDMSLEIFRTYLDTAIFPVAEGTTRYLREIGQWTAADDAWNKKAIEVDNKLVAIREAFHAEAKTKGLNLESEEAAALWNDKYVPTLPGLMIEH